MWVWAFDVGGRCWIVCGKKDGRSSICQVSQLLQIAVKGLDWAWVDGGCGEAGTLGEQVAGGRPRMPRVGQAWPWAQVKARVHWRGTTVPYSRANEACPAGPSGGGRRAHIPMFPCTCERPNHLESY